MKQTVQVLSVTGRQAVVAYDRPTACHGDCHKCAGGCGSMAAKERVTVTAENLVGAKPGDQVVIEAASGAIFSAVALVYVLPVVLFFLGYFAGAARQLGAVLGGLGFFLGLAAAVLVSRRQTQTGREIQFRIVAYSD
jgi:sigma-E factor negative regulatory protein RseC